MMNNKQNRLHLYIYNIYLTKVAIANTCKYFFLYNNLCRRCRRLEDLEM